MGLPLVVGAESSGDRTSELVLRVSSLVSDDGVDEDDDEWAAIFFIGLLATSITR